VREPEGIETPRPGKSSESGLVKTNHLHPQVWICAILREVHAADVQFSGSVLAILTGSVGRTYRWPITSAVRSPMHASARHTVNTDIDRLGTTVER
jgi:hypothetical protein